MADKFRRKTPMDRKSLLSGAGGMVMKLPPTVLPPIKVVPTEGVTLDKLERRGDHATAATFSTPLDKTGDLDRINLKQVEEEIADRADAEGLYIPRGKIRKAVKRSLARMKARSRLETWADQVQEHCGDVRVLSSATGPIKVVLTCEEGDHDVEWTSANRIPAEQVAVKLKREGWTLGRHIRCPEHARPKRKKGDNVVELVTKNDQADASEKARTAKRLTMLALDESFQIDKGQYKPGVSDATIAKELGISEQTVAKLRIEFYGELKVPDGIEDVQRQVAELKATYLRKQAELQTEFEQKLSKLDSRLDALVSKNGWKVA